METFENYMESNPRKTIEGIDDTELKGFFEYAKEVYKDYDQVNWTSFDDEIERDEEVENYLTEALEALLLYRKYIGKQK